MTLSIDPVPKRFTSRRARKADAEPSESTSPAEPSNLPVPISAVPTPPPGTARFGGSAAIDAQVLGERRGLRAGATIHDVAKASYNRTEWSGSFDRRAPKGRVAKTKI